MRVITKPSSVQRSVIVRLQVVCGMAAECGGDHSQRAPRGAGYRRHGLLPRAQHALRLPQTVHKNRAVFSDRTMREAQRSAQDPCTSTTNRVHLYAGTPGSLPYAPPSHRLGRAWRGAMAAKKKLSRDQKRTLKKAKRTPPPRGAQTLLPSPSLLQPLHNAGWDNYTVLHNLPQTAKMSEVLWEFLAPYTPLAPDREAMEKLLAMAIAAWNVALFPGGERAQRLRELSTTLPAEARTDFLALIREMIARKERYFAQYTRYILNYELTEQRESYHLNVCSTLLR